MTNDSQGESLTQYIIQLGDPERCHNQFDPTFHIVSHSGRRKEAVLECMQIYGNKSASLFLTPMLVNPCIDGHSGQHQTGKVPSSFLNRKNFKFNHKLLPKSLYSLADLNSRSFPVSSQL